MKDVLYHYGIKGMRWGVRRYQNEDGSLTDAGKRRYSGNGAEVRREYDSAKYNRKEASRTYKRSANRYGSYSTPITRVSKKTNAKRESYKKDYEDSKIKYKDAKKAEKEAKKAYKELKNYPDISTWNQDAKNVYYLSKQSPKTLSSRDMQNAIARTELERRFAATYAKPTKTQKAANYVGMALGLVTGNKQATVQNLSNAMNVTTQTKKNGEAFVNAFSSSNIPKEAVDTIKNSPPKSPFPLDNKKG